MTDKEKAIIIAKKNHQIYDDYYDSMQECIESAIQMAEWKDEENKEKMIRIYNFVSCYLTPEANEELRMIIGLK